MSNVNIKMPLLYKDILPTEMFERIQKSILNRFETAPNYNDEFGRADYENPEELNEAHEYILPMVREYYKSNTIMPAWTFLAVYYGKEAKLPKHLDFHAASYSVDLQFFHREKWPLYILGEEFTLDDNDAVFMNGNDLVHWRNDFPSPETNVVANAFFFYVEQDHWWFKEGDSQIGLRYEAYKKRVAEGFLN
jgi:hypothetical protein